MRMNIYFLLILGGIFTLAEASQAVENQADPDYSVANEPGSPGDSSNKTTMDDGIKVEREAVREANNQDQKAITRYGPNSPEAAAANQTLDEKHRTLDGTLFEQGQMSGPAFPNPKMPGDSQNNPNPMPPAHQVEF